jgi:apolipoprotein N-acyltransferase
LKKPHPLLLSSLSGLLLFAAWPVSPLTFLIFIAFIPLLWLEQQGVRRKKFFGWVYLSMLIWNAAATWWIWNATGPGAVAAILANSLLMCLPWLGFHFLKKRLGPVIGYLSLIAFWLSFEYIHLQDWGLSWPWLTLGNVFAAHPGWVQWYEFTGTSGGSCWVLIVNVLIFQVGRRVGSAVQQSGGQPSGGKIRNSRFPSAGVGLLLALLVPFVLSFALEGGTSKLQLPDTNVVIVQPNIDPYEKLYSGSFDAQLQKLIRLSESSIDSHTVLVVWPETALYMENKIDEEHLKENCFLNPLWDFLRRHPSINLLTGIESYRLFSDPHNGTARVLPNSGRYAEDYNAAVMLDSSGAISFYHKSMLVPGVETLPPFLHFLDSWFERFGGTTSGYTGQKERTVLSTSNHSYRIAPAVCYESIYGEFLSRYVRNGADLIAIITNDGWWGNTPGYRQHENYARLRAIETRRWLVRSANTGVSCIIDPKGAIIDPQPWDVAAVIKHPVPASGHELTFYVQYGDCISKLAIALAIFFFCWNIITIIKMRYGRG